MVAASDELRDRPLGVRYFGYDFALYCGKSGRVVMLEAYCAHMRTHLAVNSTSYIVREGNHIDGDAIRCSYHGWRYQPDGQCDERSRSGSINGIVIPISIAHSCSGCGASGIALFRSPERLLVARIRATAPASPASETAIKAMARPSVPNFAR
jgi:nitrite reductase/ring-hydroxylating ferredoxin subunit